MPLFGNETQQVDIFQKAVIDQLHERMQLNLEIDKMSQTELQKQVDEAIKQVIFWFFLLLRTLERSYNSYVYCTVSVMLFFHFNYYF